MAGTIKVICTLPHGIVAEVNGVKVNFAGANQNCSEFRPLLGDYGVTEVDADFWAAWKKENINSRLVLSGAISEAKDEKSAKDKGADQATIDTGFKPLDPNSNGVETDNGE